MNRPTHPAAGAANPFRVALGPGVTAGRWGRTWVERFPTIPFEVVPVQIGGELDALSGHEADMALARQPIDFDGLGSIALYDERTVAVMSVDHPLAEVEGAPATSKKDAPAIRRAKLANEVVFGAAELEFALPAAARSAWGTTASFDDPPTAAAAVSLAATGVGVAVLPLSLARLYHRKDVTSRVIEDAPTTAVALVWLLDRASERTDEFIGIVRGRTSKSSRGTLGASLAAGEQAAPQKQAPAPQKATRRTPDKRVGGQQRGRVTRGRARRARRS